MKDPLPYITTGIHISYNGVAGYIQWDYGWIKIRVTDD